MMKLEDNKVAVQLIETIENINAAYTKQMTDLCKSIIGEEYSCSVIHSNSIRIGFYHGVWSKTNSPMFHDTTIYTGYDYCYRSGLAHKWQWNYNISAMGSFNPNETNTREYKYYIMISRLIENSKAFEALAKEYYDKVEVFNSQLSKIKAEINKANSIEAAEIAKKEKEERYKRQTSLVSNADCSTYFVCESCEYHANFVYRKKPVRLVVEQAFESENDARIYVSKTFGWRSVKEYKYIQKTKLNALAA